jgi:hypothetical protein
MKVDRMVLVKKADQSLLSKRYLMKGANNFCANSTSSIVVENLLKTRW